MQSTTVWLLGKHVPFGKTKHLLCTHKRMCTQPRIMLSIPFNPSLTHTHAHTKSQQVLCWPAGCTPMWWEAGKTRQQGRHICSETSGAVRPDDTEQGTHARGCAFTVQSA